MHDLNNVIAQQSLVVENAERFRHNPKFVDDAIDTIAHSVSRMKRLMEQLSSGSKVAKKRPTEVMDALRKAVERCRASEPTPRLEADNEQMLIEADSERLITIFEHLIKNAQDATPTDGRVTVVAGDVNWHTPGAGNQYVSDQLGSGYDNQVKV